jgi:hypothetical protein
MRFLEEISWILDPINKQPGEERYQKNIDFVHSLGKTCDCVGWSLLRSDDPAFDEILEKIQQFCERNGWRARCYYDRIYLDVESDWFEIVGKEFKSFGYYPAKIVPTDDGTQLLHYRIRAYQEQLPSPKCGDTQCCVPERFRNACLQLGMNDVTFCWEEDVGRYAAEQYFHLYPQHRIPYVACNRGFMSSSEKQRKLHASRIAALGGCLPKISELFYDIQQIRLPLCYRKEDMPEGGMAYLYCAPVKEERFISWWSRRLIHRETAEKLIQAKALSWKDLRAAPVLDACPDGYVLVQTCDETRPTEEYIAQMQAQYEILKQTDRPTREVREKEVLTILRKAKRDRKQDFAKRITQRDADAAEAAGYGSLLPYYGVANGGYLSDEYRFLSYTDSRSATDECNEMLDKDELLEERPCGVVIATCANGDMVLLLQDGSVIRWGHEEPEVLLTWKNVAQFFYDAITDSE